MAENGEDYDVDLLVELVKKSSTYDEFRIQCDMNDIESIIAREEYDNIRQVFCSGTYSTEQDVTWQFM